LAQIYLGESSPPALTTFKERQLLHQEKASENTILTTSPGDLREGCFLKGIEYFDMRRVMLRIWCFERILTMF